MKDEKGYIRAKGRDPFLAHALREAEARGGVKHPATAPEGRAFGLCGAPAPKHAPWEGDDLRALVGVLRYEIAPALWEIARAIRIREALDNPPFSPCAPRKRARREA